MNKRILPLLSLLLLTACSALGPPPTTPTVTAPAPTVTVNFEGGWVGDAQKEEVAADGQAWVAAWFAGEAAMPDSLSRWWQRLDTAEPLPPETLLARSVDLLDEPPPQATSAFARGLDVRDVSVEDGQVWIDLDAESPGLYGHGSAGLLVGGEQLKAAAAFYFPEAHTLCVAYDGVPTNVEEGGPIFLHDASGCPIPLP